jgi:thiol-disulfide isomerase/thioredoxin
MSQYRMFRKALQRSHLITGLVIILLGLPLALMAKPPNLSLPDLEGTSHSLSEYVGKGKWTIVNIWGPRCPPCQEELPELVHFHDEHYKIDATVLGIALDYPSFGDAKVAEVADFVDAYLVEYPILLGNAEIVGKLGGGRIQAMPTTLAYTPEGELVAVQVGMITQEIIENFISDYKPD